MWTKRTAATSVIVAGFLLAIGIPSTAGAMCWVCVSGSCQTNPWGWGAAGCRSGTDQCELNGNCQQTLAISVTSVRLDGLMIPVNGLPQLMAASAWSPSRMLASGAYAELFPSPVAQRAATNPADGQFFSVLFAIAPNSGVASSDRCEAYLVDRTYSQEQAASLREESTVFSI